MEQSNVIEQDTSAVTEPTNNQTPVQDADAAPQVLEQPTNIYANATAPNQPIGEKDHASEIALNSKQSKNTYNYNSQGERAYDQSIKTTTTQSTGANLSATWDSEYKMNNKYAAKAGEDYSWNKLAAEMSQSYYDQEAEQYRAESIKEKQEIDKAAGEAWNNYFAAEYSARQTQDKMGWTGGQKTASDLQVAFLQAETAANMYSQDEMQRYGMDSKLAIARKYADANQKTLALQYYQDAVDKAISEANLTGWYVPPEASEMFKQQDMARQILNSSSSTASAKARARSVIANCNKYYEKLGFQKGYAKDKNGKVVTEYYGIKTLATLEYEETVRNNKVMEDLERQANKIAQQQANAALRSAAAAEAQVDLGWHIQNQNEINYIMENNSPIKDVSKFKIYNSDGKAIGNAADKKGKVYKSGNKYYYIESYGTGFRAYEAK